MAKKSGIKGGIFGVLIGVIGGILFAPKSGKETRKDLKEAAIKANMDAEKRLKQLHSDLKEKSNEAKDKAEELTGKAKEEMSDLAKKAEFAKGKVSELITAVREFEADDKEVEKVITDGKNVIEKIVNSAKEKTSSKKK